MAFDYLSGSTSISNILFNDILKISPNILYKYVTPQDQALYLLFIPSIVILFFVWSFGYWFTGSGNRAVRILISIATYIFIVYAGWYGSFMVSIILAWFPILILSSFVFFILSKWIHPAKVIPIADAMKATAEKFTEKNTKMREQERKIDLIDEKIRQLDNMQKTESNERARATLIAEMSILRQNRIEEEEKLKRLGG